MVSAHEEGTTSNHSQYEFDFKVLFFHNYHIYSHTSLQAQNQFDYTKMHYL